MAKNKKSKDEEKKSKKGKSHGETEKKGSKDKSGKKGSDKESKKDYSPRDVKKGSWDEQKGGGDFFSLKEGEHECLLRVRSVISLGQCVHEFNGKKADRATSTIGFVIEAWPFKIKKDEIKLTTKEPAIIYHSFKAIDGNKDSHWTSMKRDLEANNPGDFMNAVGIGTIKATKQGGMYLQKRIFKTGVAERKACPKLTKKGHSIPNLNEMTKEALLELNSFFQVAQYLTKAVNYPDSKANELVDKIRKDKPDFGKAIPKGDKEKAKKKGKKKKLDEDKEY